MTKQLLIPDTQNLPKYQLKKKKKADHSFEKKKQ